MFKEDDIRKRAEDEQKVCKKHKIYEVDTFSFKRQNWQMQREAGGLVKHQRIKRCVVL